MESHIAAFIFGFAACGVIAGSFFTAQGYRLHTWLTTDSAGVKVSTDIDGVKIAMVRLDESRPAIVTVGGLIELAESAHEEVR